MFTGGSLFFPKYKLFFGVIAWQVHHGGHLQSNGVLCGGVLRSLGEEAARRKGRFARVAFALEAKRGASTSGMIPLKAQSS